MEIDKKVKINEFKKQNSNSNINELKQDRKNLIERLNQVNNFF